MKLKDKIILWFTCCISAVFLGLLLLTRASILNSNKNITDNLNTQILQLKSIEIGSWLNQRISEVRIISQTEALRNMDMKNIKPFIDRLNNELGEHYGNEYGTFAAGGRDGLGWVTDYQTIDVSQREYFIEAMSTDEEYIISNPVVSHTNEDNILLICYPVYNDNEEKIGFVNGAISIEKITEITDNIQFYDGVSWIMDKGGNIYSTKPIKGITDEHIRRLKPLLAKANSSDVSIRSFEDMGEADKMVFYSSIPYSEGWTLCTMISANSLNKDTNELMYTILWIWLVMLVISIILCILFSRSVTAPVNKLNNAMQSVQNEDFDVYCDVADNGKDEIANLAKSFNIMVQKIKSLMDRIKYEEKEKRSAELQVLQSQINPHFLYNTLDNLQWKAYDYNAVEISDMISALSNFFRISLSKGKEFIPLKKEIEHIENYLFIQKKRYEDILDFSIELPAEAENFIVPKLIIQPIVENAIYHGIKPKLENGKIDVKVVLLNDDIYIHVNDDGIGISAEDLENLMNSLNAKKPHTGYGLHNVNQRIQLVYGKEYGIQIESEMLKGTTVTVHIPATQKEDDYGKTNNSR